MTRVLVLYYSSYGHVEQMAQAVVEGAKEAGAEVTLKHIRETAPAEVVEQAGFKSDLAGEIAEPTELGDYDAIILGSPTRYGNMCSQVQSFWDQTGPLWAKGALVGKVASAFTSTASQHGGQETTLISMQKVFLHHGMVVVGLPYAYEGLTLLDEVSGGTPYGASTIAGGDGSRQPSRNELDGARFQGKHVAQIAAKLSGN